MHSILRQRTFLVSAAVVFLIVVDSNAQAQPKIVVTERYRNETLQLVIAEANRIAQELNLDEQLPITKSNLTLISLIPVVKTFGPFGVIDTRNYVYSLDVKEFGIVCSGVCRKGYDDFLEAQRKYVWPSSRYNTNHAFQMAKKWIAKAEMDVEALNRDCYVKIGLLGERKNFGEGFFPDYIVTWHQKANTFHISAGEVVGCVEFIEPMKRVRQLQVNDLSFSKYILRKPLRTIDYVGLLTPENSLDAVLYGLRMATNYEARIENLRTGGAPEHLLRNVWQSYTNAPFPANLLAQTNASRFTVP